MGFLMGAYGKLMAGKLKRDLEFQLGLVTRRYHKVTKEIQDKTRMYESQERNMKMQMQAQMSVFNCYYMGLDPNEAAMNLGNFGYFMGAAQGGYVNQAKQMQEMQMQFARANSMWQNVFEMQKEADLQALKDIEADLEIEKNNLESRLEIARNEYQYYKDQEKANAKNIAPEYTGGQG